MLKRATQVGLSMTQPASPSAAGNIFPPPMPVGASTRNGPTCCPSPVKLVKELVVQVVPSQSAQPGHSSIQAVQSPTLSPVAPAFDQPTAANKGEKWPNTACTVVSCVAAMSA